MLKIDARNKTFFYLLLAFAVYAAYSLLRPYLGVVIFALVIVVVFRPVYQRYLLWTRRRQGLAIAMTIVTIFVVMLIPVALITEVTVSQAIQLSRDVAALNTSKVSFLSWTIDETNRVLERLPFDHGFVVTEAEIVRTLKDAAAPLGSFLAEQALEVGASTVDIVTNLIVFLAVLAAMLPAWPKMIGLLKDLSPLDDEVDQRYIDRATAMTNSMVRGIFVVAVVQGAVMGLFLWIAGVPYTAFWTLLSVVLSILPVGASLVAVPVGIILLLTGNIWQGLVVILGYVLVVSNVDAFLRPRLVPRDAQISSVLVLLSLFGGVKLFGFLGVIYGPVVMIFLLTTVEVYLEHRRYVRKMGL